MRGTPGNASMVTVALAPTETKSTSISSTIPSTSASLGSMISIANWFVLALKMSPGATFTAETNPSNGASSVVPNRPSIEESREAEASAMSARNRSMLTSSSSAFRSTSACCSDTNVTCATTSCLSATSISIGSATSRRFASRSSEAARLSRARSTVVLDVARACAARAFTPSSVSLDRLWSSQASSISRKMQDPCASGNESSQSTTMKPG